MDSTVEQVVNSVLEESRSIISNETPKELSSMEYSSLLAPTKITHDLHSRISAQLSLLEDKTNEAIKKIIQERSLNV